MNGLIIFVPRESWVCQVFRSLYTWQLSPHCFFSRGHTRCEHFPLRVFMGWRWKLILSRIKYSIITNNCIFKIIYFTHVPSYSLMYVPTGRLEFSGEMFWMQCSWMENEGQESTWLSPRHLSLSPRFLRIPIYAFSSFSLSFSVFSVFLHFNHNNHVFPFLWVVFLNDGVIIN